MNSKIKSAVKRITASCLRPDGYRGFPPAFRWLSGLRRASLLTVCVCFFLLGCDSSRVYEDNLEFKDRAWKVAEKPTFEFAIFDTVQVYSVYYNVRNSLDYPYARIFITYSLYDSAGQELSRKLVYNDLFDEKTGRPFGSSGIGDLYDHRFQLLEHHRFRHAGKYSVKLDQFMRQDTLPGVVAVGIRVEKVARQ